MEKVGSSIKTKVVLVKQPKISLAEDDKDCFEKKWKNGITGDELFGDVIEYLKTLPWKK